jgi:hypothetical protein
LKSAASNEISSKPRDKDFGVGGRYRTLVEEKICEVQAENARLRAKLLRGEVLVRREIIYEERDEIEAAARQLLVETCVLMTLIPEVREGCLEIKQMD